MTFKFFSKKREANKTTVEFSVDGIDYIARMFSARSGRVSFSEWATDKHICTVCNLSPVIETAIQTAFEVDKFLVEDYHRRKGDLLEFSLGSLQATLVFGLAGTDFNPDDPDDVSSDYDD